MKELFRKTLLIATILLTGFHFAQAQKNAYVLYKADGKKAKYGKMLEVAAEADIVLFGEYHTNPISHWLQLELTRDLYDQRGEDLVLGAEMFESDNQLIMDEYLQGWIDVKKFEEEARLWKNYETDYKPLVLLAKENGLKFIATNIPRRYASLVFKKGVLTLDSLSAEAKSYIAPLPLEYDKDLDCYKQLMGGMATGKGPMMKSRTDSVGSAAGMKMPPMHARVDTVQSTEGVKMPPAEHKMPSAETKDPMKAMTDSKGPGVHGSSNLADAQAIKDATMSHFLLKNWEEGKLFVHYQGAYHSDSYESMNWFLLQANPDLKIVTISTVSQADVSKLEEEGKGKADFIIAVPETMTQTSR